MNGSYRNWAPALVLGVGLLLTLGNDTQRAMPLRAPLESVLPTSLEGYTGQDVMVSDEEEQVAGMSDYLMRVYKRAAGAGTAATAFSLYVGYYESQTQGKTIHSPKNCLPGGGWEALTSRKTAVTTASGSHPVNQYLLQNGKQRALVLYWYQGRGRIEADEYKVKWELLRDSALRRRSDEALVRILVPVTSTEDRAFEVASQIARTIIPAVDAALPS